MIVVCPSCSSAWELPAERAASGARVRCAACREAWYAPPAPDANESAADVAVIDVEASCARPSPEPLLEAPRRPRLSTDRARSGRPGLRRVAAAALAALVATTMVAQRERVVAAAPATARLFAVMGLPVNLAGLEFRNVKSMIAEEGGQRVLAVAGEVTNVTRRAVTPPPLAVSLRGEDGRSIYVWTAEPPAAKLAPGESAAFRTRLAAPPERAREVLVSLAEAAPAVEPKAGRKK